MLDKTVLITGSSRGIGRAIGERFAGNFARIALNYKSSVDEMKNLLPELRKTGSEILELQGDVSDYNAVEAMFEKTEAAFGNVDVLINNAGTCHNGLFTDMTPAQWENIFKVNTFSVFNCSHRATPSMVRNKSGVIINISSVWGLSGASCEAVYSGSKGAVNSFTKALAKELAPSGICVNAIACGVIDTGMNGFLSRSERDALCDEIPAGRFGDPREVAELAYFLSAGDCKYLTGQIITLDGGLL